MMAVIVTKNGPTSLVHILRAGLTASVVFLGLTAAALGTWSSIQTKSDQSVIHMWFRTRWAMLSDSSWRTLPQRVVEMLLGLAEKISSLLPKSDGHPNWFTKAIAVSDISAAMCVAFVIGLHQPIRGFVVGIVAVASIILFYRAGFKLGKAVHDSHRVSGGLFFLTLGMLTKLILVIFLIRLSLHVELLYSTVISIVAAPLMLLPCLLFSNFVGFVRTLRNPDFTEIAMKYDVEVLLDTPSEDELLNEYRWIMRRSSLYGLFVSMGVSLSLLMTFSALTVGHVIEPTLPVPRSAQLLVINGLFDGMTLAMTVWVLERAVIDRRFPLPLAVLADVVLAGLFAVLSGFLGVLRTPYSLSMKQACYVLLGRGTNGISWQLGPLFWVVHTSFIPTILYLCIVLLSYCAKATIGPTQWFLGKGAHEDINAIGMTSRFVALLGAINALFLYVLNVWS